MFGIGGTEFFIIALFVVLLFGPEKLPDIGRTIGKWTREFRRAQDQMQAQIRAEMDELNRLTDPFAKKPAKADEETSESASEAVDSELDEEEEDEE